MTTLALVPSPLLGPATWAPVGDLLRDAGWRTVTTGRRRAGTTSTPSDMLADLPAELPEHDDLVVVPHSNAGLYVPAVADQRRVVGAVMVDAALPPADGTVATAPPHLVEHLRRKADAQGLLPPWTQWWDEPDVAAVFPTRQVRATVEAEQRRLPLAYFGQRLPVPAGWDRRPCAYLSFGDTYADEREQARRRGWPVERLPGGHLHQLMDPPAVAAALSRLLSALGLDGLRLAVD